MPSKLLRETHENCERRLLREIDVKLGSGQGKKGKISIFDYCAILEAK